MSFAKRIAKELADLPNKAPEGINWWLADEDDLTILEGKIEGPAGSPYEGGIFLLDITLKDYPFKPPIIKFRTNIVHVNIYPVQREMCLDIL